MRTTAQMSVGGVLLLLTHAIFASDADQATGPLGTAPESASPPASATVREVTIDPGAPVTDCRKTAPTGSRIATRRCTTSEPKPDTPSARVQDLQKRRDLEQMRATQQLQEQARAQARAEAMRRRAMGL